MKKVCLVLPTLGVGGGEKLVIDIAKNLNIDKFEVRVICLFSRKETIYSKEFEKTFDVIYLDKKIGFDLGIIIKIIKILKKEKPDIVHTHLNVMQFILPAYIFCKIPKKIHTVHSIAEKEAIGIKKYIMKFSYKYLNVIPVAICKTVKKSIENYYELASDNNVICIENGIDLSRYIEKKNFCSNKDIITFITTGTLYEAKNHLFMIECFFEVYKKHKNIELIIIGDGILRDNLKSKVLSLKLDNIVIFKGYIEAVEEELNKADIFLMTSRYEGLPLAILEAMSIGLPVIATKVGGIVDIVENGKNGFLVDSNNKSKFIEKMELLIIDDELRKNMQKKSKLLSKKYDVKDMVIKYERLYERK